MPIPMEGLAEKRWRKHREQYQDQPQANLVENKPVTTVIQKGNMEFVYEPDKISVRFTDRPEPPKVEPPPPPTPIITERTLREMEEGRKRIAMRHDRTLREMEAGRKNNARYHPVEAKAPEEILQEKAKELVEENQRIVDEAKSKPVPHQVKLMGSTAKLGVEIQPPGDFKEYAPMHKPTVNKLKGGAGLG